MNPRSDSLDRRAFLAGAAAAAASPLVAPARAAEAVKPKHKFCAFIKFVQTLGYDEMAERVAALGFDGVESTVRAGGHVLPERVKDDLPRHVEAIRRAGLDPTIFTTDVVAADGPHVEDVLRTGASLGLKTYRMGFCRYNAKRGVLEQLAELRPRFRDLAAMNRELGLSAVYQNHCGANMVGGPVWDLHSLLEGIDPTDIGVAFDLRHATVEGGLTWPLEYDLVQPRVRALFVKDFRWSGPQPEHVPLGTGRIDPGFYKRYARSGAAWPISVHVEYLQKGTAEENLAALGRDLNTLRGWLSA